MRTFHAGGHELHGITVIVDTDGEEIYVGRCDDVDDDGMILLDVDLHRDGDGGQSKEDYVRRAAELGVWKKYARLVIPTDRIVSVRRLGDL